MMPDLDPEATPPSVLRTRVLRTLRARGLLRPAARWRPAVLRVAAALLLFALGGWVGRATAPAAAGPAAVSTGATRYVLLLDADDRFRWDVPESRLVDEYRTWAAEQRTVRFARGERLDDLTLVLTPDDAAAGAAAATLAARAAPTRVGITGYFVIDAASWEEAVDVARTCPHLRYGGRIILRPVAPT
jgi:hypothetical protein